MSVGLRGSLKDFGIAEVFQLIGQQRKTGVLEIERRRKRVELRFDAGSVVSAAPVGGHPEAALGEMLVRCGLLPRERLEALELERASLLQTLSGLLEERRILSAIEIEQTADLLTRETVFDLLRWSEGSFRFTASIVEHERDPSALLPAEQILMDGLRMVDEWRTFASDVPSPDAVFRRCGHFEEYRERSVGEARRRLPAAERLVGLIDGRLSAQRVIDLSRLGTFEGTRLLSDLRRGGVIDLVDPGHVPRAARRLRPELKPVHVRAGLASATPLALLLLLAVSPWREAPAPESTPDASFAIERPLLDTARAALATRRIHAALAAYRFAHGAWPPALDDLVAAGLLDARALTPFEGRSYYYARRGDGVLLLAPEH